MSIGLLGRKVGMTRVYDDKGKVVPVTVIDVSGSAVLQLKTEETDGYCAVQVGCADQKPSRVTKAELGHFAKSGATPKRFVREFRLPAGSKPEVSGELKPSHFAVGQQVDVIGQSKGKGFQGVMKKHNFAGQGAAHGSKMHRRNGAIGNRSTPGRIWKNMGMPGHMGDERVTVQNLRVVAVRDEDHVILVSGAVPGANGTFVIVRPAKKAPAAAKS